MNLYVTRRQIEVFLAVARYSSMTAAAEELHMTQPGVSQTIAELERQMGIRLFDRIGKRLHLTRGGELCRDQLRRIDLLYRETAIRMEAVAGLQEERLRIGASMTLGNYLLPGWMKQFSLLYPGVDLQLTVDNTKRIESALLVNELDMGIVEGVTTAEDLLSTPLFYDPLALVCSGSHPWSKRECINPRELEDEALVIREEGSGTRELVLRVLKDNGIPCRIGHTINNFEGIKQTVAAGLGISFLSRLAITRELESGILAMVAIENLSMRREFTTVVHRDKIPGGILQAWITFLQDAAPGQGTG